MQKLVLETALKLPIIYPKSTTAILTIILKS